MMTGFGRRVTGTMFLAPGAYEEVERERGATAQALGVVLVFGLATGFGTTGLEALTAAALAAGAAVGLIGWLAWASLIYMIGVHLLPEPQTRADVGELLRTTGFAMSPGWFLFLAAVPALRVPVYVLVAVWLLAAMVTGVRQALDYRSTARAVIVCASGWALALALAFVLSTLAAPAVH